MYWAISINPSRCQLLPSLSIFSSRKVSFSPLSPLSALPCSFYLSLFLSSSLEGEVVIFPSFFLIQRLRTLERFIGRRPCSSFQKFSRSYHQASAVGQIKWVSFKVMKGFCSLDTPTPKKPECKCLNYDAKIFCQCHYEKIIVFSISYIQSSHRLGFRCHSETRPSIKMIHLSGLFFHQRG